MPQLTEAQQALTELIESSIGDQIDAIGEPSEQDGNIICDFQYGQNKFTATIDPENGTMSY